MVFNDNGGTKRPSDFRLQLYNNGRATYFNTQGALTSTLPQTSQVVETIIQPGEYIVAEERDPRYTWTPSSGCNGLMNAIRPGETRYCTLYNDDKPAISAPPPDGQSRLVIAKKIINNNGGTARLNDFTIKVYLSRNSIPCTISNIQGCSQTDSPSSTFQGQRQFIIRPGYYFVAESPRLPGYESYMSGDDCQGNIRPGETRLCTIYNDDRPPGVSRIPTTLVIP